jgi:hypothetical protein
MGEEKRTNQGVEYFELQCQYFDFDGTVFGAVTERLSIQKFNGVRRIDTLSTYPLQWHPNSEAVKASLVVRGQKFVELIGLHHRQYDGHAFFQRKDGTVRLPVTSRIVVDAEQFRKSNPSYPRLFTQTSNSSILDFGSATEGTDIERVKSKGMAPGDLNKDDLLVCAPTVLACSLNDKFWGKLLVVLIPWADTFDVGEYAVDDIRPIQWSKLPMASLTIPTAKKEVIVAIAQRHLGPLCKSERSGGTSGTFDDVVEGKGRGIVILLQ